MPRRRVDFSCSVNYQIERKPIRSPAIDVPGRFAVDGRHFDLTVRVNDAERFAREIPSGQRVGEEQIAIRRCREPTPFTSDRVLAIDLDVDALGRNFGAAKKRNGKNAAKG